jgi:hypothetical protein
MLGLKYIESTDAAAPRESDSAGSQPMSAWENYAQTLLLTNEFMFVD